MAEEGRFLIYDQRVMRAIAGGVLPLADDIWTEARQQLCPPVPYFPRHRHCASYGHFLEAAAKHACRNRMVADDVDLWLFENAPGRPAAYVSIDDAFQRGSAP